MPPKSLRDWTAWAARLNAAVLYYHAEFKDAALNLSDATFAELAAFYEQAHRRGDLARVDAWLQTMRRTVPMDPDERAVRNLLHLFSHVAKTWGRKPFTNYELSADKLRAPPTPDWSKLPADLAFLAGPAADYAGVEYVFSDEVRDNLRRSATAAADHARLAPVAQAVRTVGFKTVRDWCSRMGLREHVEASMVFDLLGVLDAMDLLHPE